MVIKYHISAAPAITENLVVKVYEASNDSAGAEVYQQTLATPHSSPRTITINGMDKVVHVIRLYGATSGTKYHEYNLEPTTQTAEVFEPLQFKIGDGGTLTPAAGASTYQNDLLKGLTEKQYTITRNNYGVLIHGVHYTHNSAAGSFTLMGADQMGEGEEFTVQIGAKLSEVVGNDSVVGKWFAGFVDLSSDRSYEADHLRKLLRFTAGCTYTFSGAVPVGYTFCFQNYGSGTGIVKFSGSGLKWAGATKPQLNIPVETEGAFVFDGTHWNVVYLSDSATTQNQTEPKAGDILGAGTYLLNNQGSGYKNGDVTPGDPQWLVTHNLGISGDYLVLLTLKSNNNNTYQLDNKVAAPVFQHHPTNKANAFLFSLQEIDGAEQNVSVCWVAIKL